MVINMAGKIYIALFAFLAVQGWTYAGVLPQEVSILEAQEAGSGALSEGAPEVISDEVYEFEGSVPHGNPLNCVQYIGDAYNIAKEIRRLVTETSSYATIVGEDFKKCINLPGFEENVSCLYNSGKNLYPKGKELYDGIKATKEKAQDILNKFDKCFN